MRYIKIYVSLFLLSHNINFKNFFLRMYTEINREEVAVSLYIKRLSDEDAGEYLCTALYAGNLKMTASVSVSVFRKLRVHNILKKSINLSE